MSTQPRGTGYGLAMRESAQKKAVCRMLLKRSLALLFRGMVLDPRLARTAWAASYIRLRMVLRDWAIGHKEPQPSFSGAPSTSTARSTLARRNAVSRLFPS